MKDLKTVLLLTLSLVVVAAGFLLANRYLWSDEVPGVTAGGTSGGALPLYDSTVPHSQWPKADRPRGPATFEPPDRPPPEPAPDERHLDLAYLKDLLGKGDDAAWREIKRLLKMQNGKIDDPMGAAELLVGALAKGGNDATYVFEILPVLKGEAARATAAEKLLALAGESDDPQTLKAALLLVGQIGTGANVAAVASLARSLDRQETAGAAIAALGAIGSREAAVELARLLVDRRGSDVEHMVVDAIGKVGSEEMVAALTPLLSPDQPAELVVKAVEAMGRTRCGAAAEPLLALVDSGADRSVKELGVQALGFVGAVDELLELRKDPELGFAAGMALGNLESPKAVDPLLEALPDEKDVRVKVRMIDALGNIGRDEATPALRKMLDSPDESESVRARCVRSLAKMGDVDCIGRMAEILEEPGEGNRNLKIEVLHAVGDMVRLPKAFPALEEKVVPTLNRIKAAGDADPARRKHTYWYAIRALQQIEMARPR